MKYNSIACLIFPRALALEIKQREKRFQTVIKDKGKRGLQFVFLLSLKVERRSNGKRHEQRERYR